MALPTLSPPLLPSLPQDRDSLLQLASAMDMPIADACLPGVLANMALLARHAAIMAESPVADEK